MPFGETHNEREQRLRAEEFDEVMDYPLPTDTEDCRQLGYRERSELVLKHRQAMKAAEIRRVKVRKVGD